MNKEQIQNWCQHLIDRTIVNVSKKIPNSKFRQIGIVDYITDD